jgi:mediator of RNA polymerase II transcription subunit 14
LKIVSFLEIPIRASSPIPTYNFLSTLGIFAAALASHYANLKALHSRRALHILKGGKASSPITLPSIYLKLSELLPSKNQLKRTGKPWAKDVVMLTFQGLESLPPIAQDPSDVLPANTPGPDAESPKKVGQEDNFVTVTEARMVVAMPAALSILQERVDPDIAFHVRSGTFAFRLRSTVGESVIPALVERAVRIERLVEFVEVVHKHEKTLRCESISLGKIVLLYGSTDGAEAGDGSSAVPLEYRAVVNLGAPSNIMSLSFEYGNPHLLIADRLDKVLNGKQGLDGVANLLPLTLPTLRAIDAIEEAWTPLFDKGEVLVFVRAVEWYTLRYTLPPSSSSPTARVATIDIRLQQRKGQPWWFVRRADPRHKEPDAIDGLLAPVWDDATAPYRGMRVNAVAQPAAIAALLRRIDAVLRRFAATQTPLPRPPPQNRAPVAAMGHAGKPARPPKRQQPTPNQSQSQSQSHAQMEVVEID